MHRIVAFVLAEGPASRSTQVFDPKEQKSAPHYVTEAAPPQFVVGREGEVQIRTYPPHVLVAELSRTVDDVFSQEAFHRRDAMIEECKTALEKHGATLKMSEEYALAVVSGYGGPPEQFLRHGAALAGFLKSETLPLDEEEIRHTLHTQIKYGEQDLVIIDWDGAFVCEPTGNIDDVLELLQLGNLQLLRYRMLDAELDQRLLKLDRMIRTKTGRHFVFWSKEISRVLKEVIRLRAASVMEFDAIIRDIKLIGDWYNARLYDTAAKKFRLEEWRKAIREKLLSLEDITSIASENFSINKQYFVEFLLQMGWLTLLLLELYQIFS